MSADSLFLRGPDRDAVRDFFEARAEAVDCGELGVRDGLRFAGQLLMPALQDGHANHDLRRVSGALATVAWSDMSCAFTLWCQRMVLEYLSLATPGSFLAEEVRPKVLAVDWYGSTALAAGMAHAVTGAPLPVQLRHEGGDLIISGRVPWASNLFQPDMVMVSAALDLDAGHPVVVALPGSAAGIEVQPYPRLLALNATASSTVRLSDVRLGEEWLLTEDFRGFVSTVRPPFLLMQSSFAWGLARRSLDEAKSLLGGITEALRPDLDELDAEAARIAEHVTAALPDRGRSVWMRDLVQLRLDAARLATASTALEAKAAGGRGYMTDCATLRRVRESAFLPVQAPTEAQLRWELQHSA